jgi:tetratricopeptide (TPR) repeat protein
MDRYRLEARRELEIASDDSSPSALAVRWADPVLLNAVAHQLAQQGDSDWLAALRVLPVVRRNLVPAAKHLLEARRLCPLLPQAHLYLAELSFLLDPPSSDAEHVGRAGLLAGGDARLWFQLGLLDWYARRSDAAFANWKRSLELSSRYEQDVLDLIVSNVPIEELTGKVLPDSAETLLRVLENRYAGAEHEPQRQQLLARAEALLDSDTTTPRGPWWRLHAEVYQLNGEPDRAIDAYYSALQFAPQQTNWRYALAALLRNGGRLSEAREQAKWCVRQAPANPDFANLHRQILEELARE